MDDLVTLRTSDDPPVELKSARSVLVAGSKVFSDMLSLPQGSATGKEGAIDVAETQSELSPFLRLLNLSHYEGNPLEELKVDDWPVLARLADKYDSATVKALALGTYWKWRGEDCERVAAFQTAAALGDKKLATFSLLRLLQDGKNETIDAATESYKVKFDAWTGQLKLHAFEKSMTDYWNSPFCASCRNGHGVDRSKWETAMRSSMQYWKLSCAGAPFQGHLAAIARDARACLQCISAVPQQFDQAYRDSAPEFPL